MKRKLFIVLITIVVVLVVGYLCLPFIEYKSDDNLYAFAREESFGEFEENLCYSENVSYNEKRNISIISWDMKKLPLGNYMLVLGYEEGNLCANEYVLEEDYIDNFLKNAKIAEESDDVDLASLIKDKKAIVSNTRYPWNDDYKWIGYELDGKYEEMYISTNEEGLLIIQVGNSDEGPRFIAYK